MRQNHLHFLESIKIVVSSFLSWFVVWRSILQKMIYHTGRLHLFQLVFIFGCFTMAISCSFPWIKYKIQFAENYQYIGSNSRFLFFMATVWIALSFFLSFRSKYRGILSSIVFLSISAYYCYGIVFPQRVHTLLRDTDFELTVYLYIYGCALLASALSFILSFHKPMNLQKRIKKYLLSKPSMTNLRDNHIIKDL